MRHLKKPTEISCNQLLHETERLLAPGEGWSESKRRWRAQLARQLGRHPLGALTPETLINWAHALGAAWTTIDRLLLTLSGALASAEAIGLEIDLPTRRAALEARRRLVVTGHIRRPRPRRHPRLTDAELDRIQAAWSARLPSSALVVLVDTAMRSGELVRLRWADWDAQRGTVWVTDRKHPGRRHGNDQEIPLLRRAQGIVAALSLRRDPRQPRIFPGTQPQLSDAFRRAARRAGLPHHRLHDLRAEGITRLGELRVPHQTIMRISGHRSLDVLNTYFHPDPAHLHAIYEEHRP